MVNDALLKLTIVVDCKSTTDGFRILNPKEHLFFQTASFQAWDSFIGASITQVETRLHRVSTQKGWNYGDLP